jgi:hypothetical protein
MAGSFPTSFASWSAADDVVRVALLAAAVALGGCSFWYRPVPVTSAIGKERTAIAGDSFNVYRDPRFDVYGPGSRAVFDAYEQLNRAYRTFNRYFGTTPPRLSVVLYPETTKPRDSAAVAELRSRGETVLRFVRPMDASFRERTGEDGYSGSLWPVGPTAVRFLLASLATQAGMPDTTTLARLPAWYRSAVMSIVGDGTALPQDVQYVKENRRDRLFVEQLVAVERATSADSVLDPFRRYDARDRDWAFAAQSSAFMQFILEREGPAAMAALGHGFLKGESFEQQASRFRVLPQKLADLEQRWSAWVEAQRTIY